MRIAQVAPLFEAVPPVGGGGAERVIATLTNELSWAGHEVTLFAAAGSVVDAELVTCRAEPIGGGPGNTSEAADHILQFERVRRHLGDFDVIHFHSRFSHFPLFEDVAARTVTTCHDRVDLPTLARFYRRFDAFPMIAVSEAQRRSQPAANWAAAIHHGCPLDQYAFHGSDAAANGYLAFIGRTCPEQGLLDAIRIAQAAGRRLKIAARIKPGDRDYFEACIAPKIDGEQIEYVGEMGERRKTDFLNRAAALLYPVHWPEPFGLVMIEAMACGTPVIAYHEGAVTEVVEDAVTGFVVGDVAGAVDALERIASLDRSVIRQRFEERFSAGRMMEDHVRLYERLLARRPMRSTAHRSLIPRRPRQFAGLPVDGPAHRTGLSGAGPQETSA